MFRHLRLIAACSCIVASVGCDGGNVTAPPPVPTTVTVQLGGRVVDADAGGPVGNVRVWSSPLTGRIPPTGTATSDEDGTFTLSLDLPRVWSFVRLNLTAPPGYDDTSQRFEPTTAADRPEIRMYPTLVIRRGESIQVRVESNIVRAWDGYPCRRILVAGSPGDPVELEIVPDDSSQPMYLGLATQEYPFMTHEYDDIGVRRLMVPPDRVPYVINSGTARLTARR